MARAKKEAQKKPRQPAAEGYIKGGGETVDQLIVDTLQYNYMPYAMSVIMSRALPEIDGFKPSHRKLLYTMYKMGLLTGSRQKSSKIAGSTMALNPHGDAAIYDTMVRMTIDNEALLHPYVDSKGSFGKAYSRDTAPAASRYTEAKLAPIAHELFRDIEQDAVDMADNFDNTMKEPTLLPVTYPAILTNNIAGIAVGMASSICSFNLRELTETTIELIRDSGHDIISTLPAPDFPGGGYIVYNRDDIETIYKTGRGGIKVRSRYSFDKAAGCIEITEIPPTATCEAIIERIIDLVKIGKVKEIADIRDETGINGLKIAIDIKRGIDPDKLMTKLFKITPLEDSFSCNFNVLIAGNPRVMGVGELLEEWIAFRTECVRRKTYFELQKKKKRLHLLEGLSKILMDIDKAIKIIRETDEESEVVPNLMIGFGIDEVQAEYVAEIKLRHINREYILKRTADLEDIKKSIAELTDIVSCVAKIKKIIIGELKEVGEKYGQDRKTEIMYDTPAQYEDEGEEIPSYPVNIFLTKEGYFKKITPQSLRMSGEHKLKEGDRIVLSLEAKNNAELLFFTDKCQVYKSRASDFSDTKASVMGDYIPAKLSMENEEKVVYMAVTEKYDGYMLFAFENGKVAKVDMSSYETKTNRKKLIGAYSDKSLLVGAFYIREDTEVLLVASTMHKLLLHTGMVSPKTSKNTQGVQVISLRKNARLSSVMLFEENMLKNPNRNRPKAIPAAGVKTTDDDSGEQMSLILTTD
ncbi:MAG: topoisomerase IV [Oscillospiraceae bacterium]|jgi:DNA gyrase subunit A|nr:topoisomerase IV [Oscillospiraceae bacterium]